MLLLAVCYSRGDAFALCQCRTLHTAEASAILDREQFLLCCVPKHGFGFYLKEFCHGATLADMRYDIRDSSRVTTGMVVLCSDRIIRPSHRSTSQPA
jgi:hypothetical protein